MCLKDLAGLKRSGRPVGRMSPCIRPNPTSWCRIMTKIQNKLASGSGRVVFVAKSPFLCANVRRLVVQNLKDGDGEDLFTSVTMDRFVELLSQQVMFDTPTFTHSSSHRQEGVLRRVSHATCPQSPDPLSSPLLSSLLPGQGRTRRGVHHDRG